MSKEEIPQVTRRRTTRLSSSKSPNAIESATTGIDLPPLTLRNLVFGEEEPLTSDGLFSSLPGRRNQILEILRLLGPLNSPVSPLFVYGGASTGKTSTILQVFRHLNRPFVYSSCRTCYNARQLFDNILNQLLLHRKSEINDYSSAKKCEKPADFVNFLKEALVTVVDGLKGKSWSKKYGGSVNGSMVYLIFDSLELVRDWDKSGTILPLLFKLHDILKVPDVGLIFISSSSLDTYHSDTGFVDPVPVYFPDYTEDGLRQIFMRNQSNPKLRSAFLDVVLKSFCRVTKRLDELSIALSPLFDKYCEPLNDLDVIPNEEIKRKLYTCLQPHIGPALNEIFKVTSQPSGLKNNLKRKNSLKKFGNDCIDDIDFHMSISAKYLLISAFLASRNPATLDASFFDSTGGPANQKKKRKTSEKSRDLKEALEQEQFMKGPGSFPLERLLAIFQCISSSEEYSLEKDEDALETTGLDSEFGENNLMSDILLQVSSLCNANFITKGGSCPLEGSTRYRSTVSEDLALKVARSLKFPLSKYLYRR